MKFIKYLLFLGMFGVYTFELAAMEAKEPKKESTDTKEEILVVREDSKELKQSDTALDQFSLEAINKQLAVIKYAGSYCHMKIIDSFKTTSCVKKTINMYLDYGPGGLVCVGTIIIEIPMDNHPTSTIYLKSIDVHSSVRRIGLGSFLVLAAFSDAIKTGHGCLHASLDAVTPESIDFFEKKLHFDCIASDASLGTKALATSNLQESMQRYGPMLLAQAINKLKKPKKR